MPKAFADLQGDVHYILTTPSRLEIDQMIEDFGKNGKNLFIEMFLFCQFKSSLPPRLADFFLSMLFKHKILTVFFSLDRMKL